MQQQWSKPLLFILMMITLMLPGVRRFLFYQLIRNRFIRGTGLRLILALPYVRERMMNSILPNRQSPPQH